MVETIKAFSELKTVQLEDKSLVLCKICLFRIFKFPLIYVQQN